MVEKLVAHGQKIIREVKKNKACSKLSGKSMSILKVDLGLSRGGRGSGISKKCKFHRPHFIDRPN